jgi:RNA polymerase sigma-70 factor, ECF subfamily
MTVGATIPAEVAAAATGDDDSFTRLVRLYAPRVHRFLVATGISSHDADDLTQETFIRVSRHLPSYDGRASFTTWLFTIAHRLRINLVTRRRHQVPLDAVATIASDDAAPSEAGPTWSIARRVLDDRQYQALWLKYGEDLDVAAIADVLGVSRFNAKVILHRARTKLGKHLTATTASGTGLPWSDPARKLLL